MFEVFSVKKMNIMRVMFIRDKGSHEGGFVTSRRRGMQKSIATARNVTGTNVDGRSVATISYRGDVETKKV